LARAILRSTQGLTERQRLLGLAGEADEGQSQDKQRGQSTTATRTASAGLE
jgi:hypothetical protein